MALRSEESFVSYLLGALLLTLLVAVVIRSIAVRYGPKGRSLLSPWVLVMATGFALIIVVGGALRDVSRPPSCDTPTRSADQLLGELPPGLSTQPAAPELIDQLTESLREVDLKRVTAIAITRGERPQAALVSVEADERIRRRDIVGGVEQASGSSGTDVPLGDTKGRMIVTADGGAAVVGVAGPCAAAIVYGATAPVAQRVAETLRVPAG